MTSPAASSSPSAITPALISIILPIDDSILAVLDHLSPALAGIPHEILAIYTHSAALAPLENLTPRPSNLRLIQADQPTAASLYTAGIRHAAGDVLFLLPPQIENQNSKIENPLIALLAHAIRTQHAAIAIAAHPGPPLSERLFTIFTGLPSPLSGTRAYAAHFLEHQTLESSTCAALTVELAVKAQLEERPIVTPPPMNNEQSSISNRFSNPPAPPIENQNSKIENLLSPSLRPWLLRALNAPLLVWSLWILLVIIALITVRTPSLETRHLKLETLLNIALPAAGAFAFILAVRRVRTRTRIADAFFPLVLLNPLFLIHSYLRAPASPFDPTLIAAGLLGLMSGAIIAMKSDNLLRYFAVIVLAFALTQVSSLFVILLPPLAFWLLITGYRLARSIKAPERTRGFFILAAAESALCIFVLACILEPPAPTPLPATLFSTITTFADFPLLVVAILLLALGWRSGPGSTPHFAGTLALLIGLLAMLLNNFQEALATPSHGVLPPPGTDQTVLVLCLLYTVTALHGPRRLRPFAPPLLFILALAYTLARQH